MENFIFCAVCVAASQIHLWNKVGVFGKVTNGFPEAVIQRCSVKNVFLENLQNSQENTCARVSFLIKLQASGLQLY